MRAHQDLARAVELQSQVDSGEVTPLADSSKQTFDAAQSLSSQISNLKLLYQSIQNNDNWPSSLLGHLRSGSKTDVLELFSSLGSEIKIAVAERKKFLAKPISVPDGIDLNAKVVEGVRNLAQGKRPFGLAGLFGKSAEKTLLDAIRITNSPPVGTSDWQHVLNYMTHLKCLRDLLTRWNALAEDLQIPDFETNPTQITAAGEAYDLYRRLVEIVSIEGEVIDSIKQVLPAWPKVDFIQNENGVLDEAEQILLHHLTRNRLAESWALKERFQKVLSGCSGRIINEIHAFLDSALGNPAVAEAEIQSRWTALMEEMSRIHALESHLDTISVVTQSIQDSGAPKWASRLRAENVTGSMDKLLPDNWREAWKIKRLSTYLNSIDSRVELKRLTKLRADAEADLARAYQTVVTKRTWRKLAENATPDVRSALMAYMAAIARIGRGSRGAKRAIRYRQDARNAAAKANSAIPCWIMPHYRISESLPAEFGCFDLVIIDEASQSDLTALPAILRARKILIVGDDKQVSPEGVGLEEEKIRNLMTRFLANQIETYRPQMTPERSIYDLFKVVFARSAVMLKEHFRCVAPIIEYSKREFYNHELEPLRIPKASERLSPPLVDVIIEDGFRKGDINPAEARFIVDEIKAIIQDPLMTKRSIGVVSLLKDKQALKIWEMLDKEIGMDMIQRHKITCGDARTFQGKERDIMFLSMVVSKGDAKALSGLSYEQRFNVAASRAQNRMYLVRSVLIDNLGKTDIRKKLISHFSTPFAQNETDVADKRKRCESPFEREIYNILTERGYRVLPQVPVGKFRIDMVVEGHHDNRLAIECDGDRYHGIDKWDDDMRRQRILERAGWRFWRCFASTFVMSRQDVIQDLMDTLAGFGIEPIGSENNEALSIHTEQRKITAFDKANVTEI
jgi:very-short-patch-repair endonuclease